MVNDNAEIDRKDGAMESALTGVCFHSDAQSRSEEIERRLPKPVPFAIIVGSAQLRLDQGGSHATSHLPCYDGGHPRHDTYRWSGEKYLA